MKIFLIRHAQSESNVDPKELHIKTNIGINLSPLGVTQALETGQYIAKNISGENIKLWNSPYNRTRQTAQAIALALSQSNTDFIQEESIHLSERQFGLVDSVADFDTHFPNESNHYNMHREQNHDFFVRPPLGESPFDMCLRLDFFLKSVLPTDACIDTHIIVSHGAAIRGLIMMHQGQTYETYTNKNPANASVRLIEDSEYRGEIFIPSMATF